VFDGNSPKENDRENVLSLVEREILSWPGFPIHVFVPQMRRLFVFYFVRFYSISGLCRMIRVTGGMQDGQRFSTFIFSSENKMKTNFIFIIGDDP